MRFLPTSRHSAAAIRYTRSSMSAATAFIRRTRSATGVERQAGKARFAAATAALTSAASAAGNCPSALPSTGVVLTKLFLAATSLPSMNSVCVAPTAARVAAAAASKRSCICAGGLNIVA